jgi:outer membrane receptor for ferrienterochelin and colicins
MRYLNLMVVGLLLNSGLVHAHAPEDPNANLIAPHGNMLQSNVMELELPELEGNRILRLSDYAAKPMVLNFWGSYCPPCVAEMPMLDKQALRYPGVQFLGIAVDDRLKAHGFLQSQQVTYPHIVAPIQSDGIMRRFGDKSGALPYTVILDDKHRMCLSKAGGIDANWLADSLRRCAPSNI